MIDADAEITVEEALQKYRAQVLDRRWGSAAQTLLGMRPKDAIWVVKEAHNRSETSLEMRRSDVRRLISEISFQNQSLMGFLKKYLATLQQAEGPIAEAAAKLDE